MKSDSSYLNSGRLADVLTLIQILAYDVSARRTNDGLNKQLSRSPRSANHWLALARLHPEFFRVLGDIGRNQNKNPPDAQLGGFLF